MLLYDVEVTEVAQKEISRKLVRHQLQILDKKIQKLREDPLAHGKPLRYPLAGLWEFRMEKRYRVLYQINVEKRTIQIVGFKHKDEMEKLTRI
jgi:mRNA-degrading endonuclease RelE of RelBE toxin-antitoxin system